MRFDINRFENEVECLRTGIDHAVRERKISQRQYHARLEILQNLEKEIGRIKELFDQNEARKAIYAPILKTKMNDAEKKAFTVHLEEKFLFLREVEKKLSKIQVWCEEAQNKPWLKWLVPFRLSRINKDLRKTQKKLSLIDDLDIELNQYIDQVCELFSPSRSHLADKEPLKKILDLLAEQENLYSRIRTKQLEIKDSEQKVTYLKKVLSEKEHRKISAYSPESIPKKNETKKAIRRIGEHLPERIDNCRNQVQILDDLLSSLALKTATMPSSSKGDNA